MNQTTITPPADGTSTQVALALYRAVAAGDLAEAAAHLHADVVLHVPGTHPLAGVHRGLDAVLGFQLASRAATDDGETIEVLDVLAGTTRTGVLCRVTATRGDRRLDNTTVHLLRVVDGRVAEIHLHNFDGVTVDGFWS
ncbi:ester cyclase [Iamia sp. SCSIO 61187]|uniref:nuclear transport factor 2 family protein n=1 Tax=Iamia sp. SCSIO 61187 TaxID=2722752 RepID=UPI001C630E90|nr:nuclear transport factor 2 family protein [Iamia sp. SCSIO 61187]QYG95048.1 ester cyclase [Iamia sp. SCSIO 61187]